MRGTILTTILFFALPDVTRAAQQQAHQPSADQANITGPATALAKLAISDEPEQAAAACTRLRALGPVGLEALLAVQPAANAPDGATSSTWQTAVDTVAGQHEASTSGFYWYTDFDRAKKAAQSTGKPILSLRLLGKLTDEYSCANSRFFRKTLYPDPAVSAYLRQNFVLHWQSVRPVPVVTIDFGDGRKMKQTITGNSIHYVLDSHGRVVDALPGLYTPAEFLKQVTVIHQFASKCDQLSDQVLRFAMHKYHTAAIAKSDLTLHRELTAMGSSDVNLESLVEPAADSERTEPIWDQIAARRLMTAPPARNRKLPAKAAGRLAVTKSVTELPMLAVVSNFDRHSMVDSVRNEFALHRRIHQWLADVGRPAQDVDSFNEVVYREVFLSPLDDPWYGLKPDAYTGLTNDGVMTRQVSQADR